MEPTITSYLLKFALTFLLFISNMEKSSSSATAATTKSSSSAYKEYLKTACSSTTYPKLCYSSLSPYCYTIKTDDLTLCSTALNVSLQVAYNTSSLVTVLSKQKGLSKTEAQVIEDCIDEMGDSIDELSQSLDAFGSLKLNSTDLRFQISNIQTWVSAALTNEDTCSDEIDDTRVSSSAKKKIKKSISNVARITCNALALINKLPY
ncbi:21 kDa protein precursor, putative [Ricinus communis]|uniref:21 kDa protein, putative n=1 Tax=Ricinus communis TaxID=3988 RepID=B9SUG5_RICCO|nr:21 kDa protein precursor, putative [Ricinus communis]|eukprot:XP_002529634.1 pectinesterase inhibitor 4 [Ricinus communis]